ncbi:hypothetical protein SEA_TYPHA_73 [Mycobacterium phage Typha]|uniref:Uncharacterized protein n=1 Tax=Mycobacterium phage Typha TaxID=2517971 RepID=A0A482JAI9_9CAUD|nr:hypothetical protein KCH40_gp096 [Mycobacterium phage Typha]QBP29728.1 hypothetical protein SEA_TYPHA_73 [Mycobacterium phage Typha]
MTDTWNEEWRSAVRAMTEVEREVAADSHRAAVGLAGDRSDAYDNMPRGRR